jgi:hypothetical protein
MEIFDDKIMDQPSGGLKKNAPLMWRVKASIDNPLIHLNITQAQTRLRSFLRLTHHQAAGHEEADD